MKKEIKDKASKIKLLLLDVDGVMTDGSIILDNNGNELKRFHVRDGHGIRMLQKVGITVGIITGRKSKVVEVRAKELGIKEVHQKIFKKSAVYEKLLKKYKCKDENVAFMGDDIVDQELLKRAGLSAAPCDAEEVAKKFADMVTKRGGGRGAVREFTDLILKATGLWKQVSEETFG
ncbi:3-deoxy-D-manno-octulosonate 8-phosphate phosphatase KdsC [bacterium BMS3Abin09]|nr:3-deoxy-D-manno-octulosonate 8-phosphate phosphatase KdsC [bacterium BMS3Abin09]GBE41123.1 3-deoxy-D-manno-octulosonate 8-phosphate phosphatase KdsC [bacterium BMS3Bbin09]